MKKAIAILTVFTLCILLCGCYVSEKVKPVTPDKTEAYTFEDINNRLGCFLAPPKTFSPENESLLLVTEGETEIAEYRFNIGKAEYVLRFSPMYYEDIAGVTLNGEKIFKEKPGEKETVAAGNCIFIRWADVCGQYVFRTEKNKYFNSDEFYGLFEKIEEKANPSFSENELYEYYISLTGHYTEEQNENTVCDIAAQPDCIALVCKSGNNTWLLSAKRGEDGLMYFDDCEKRVDGNTVYRNKCGYISEYEGIVSFNGVEDADCKDFKFKK